MCVAEKALEYPEKVLKLIEVEGQTLFDEKCCQPGGHPELNSLLAEISQEEAGGDKKVFSDKKTSMIIGRK